MYSLHISARLYLCGSSSSDLSATGRQMGALSFFVNAQMQCVCFFVFQAVQWGARWPFGCCRGGITVTVWQSGPQPSCNGWALSRWTPLLPLFSPPHYLMCPPFPPRHAMCGLLLWVVFHASLCKWGIFVLSSSVFVLLFLTLFLQKHENVTRNGATAMLLELMRLLCNELHFTTRVLFIQ